MFGGWGVDEPVALENDRLAFADNETFSDGHNLGFPEGQLTYKNSQGLVQGVLGSILFRAPLKDGTNGEGLDVQHRPADKQRGVFCLGAEP